MRILIATLLITMAQGAPGEEWLLVRSSAAQVGTLSWERVAAIYLANRESRIVPPDAGAEAPETSRMVVGSPDDNPLVRELAPALGIEIGATGLRYRGQDCGPGTGLVVITSDPDGQGRLVLMTGMDAAGVWAGFGTSINSDRREWLVVRDHVVLARGKPGLALDTSRPLVVRLDRDLTHLLGEAGAARADERVLRVARGLEAYAAVFERLGFEDPQAYARHVLGDGAREIATAEGFFAGRDLSAEIEASWARCAEVLGEVDRLPPVYYVVHGPVDGTNATLLAPDGVTARPGVVLNLGALARAGHWAAVLPHETSHTMQAQHGVPLFERAMREGVSTALSQAIDPEVSDHDAMLWSPEELAAARERHAQIVAAFRRHAKTTDEGVKSTFLELGVPLAEVRGAPSRTGYYVGWLSARAWLEADASRTPADLLRAPYAEVWAAFDG